VVLYPRDDVMAMLEAAGLSARVLAGYGDELSFEPGLCGFSGRKPA
jgi:hypothetical protein